MRVRFAVTALARMRGMLGSPTAAVAGREGEVLVLAPCNRIHTFGMRFALDVAYVAADGRVLRVACGLVPGRVPPRCPAAVAVLERRAAPEDWFLPGQQVALGVLPDAQERN